MFVGRRKELELQSELVVIYGRRRIGKSRLFQHFTREIIPEMERKCRLLDIPAGYTIEKALVSLYGPDESLKKTAYFHHSITLEDMF